MQFSRWQARGLRQSPRWNAHREESRKCPNNLKQQATITRCHLSMR